MNTERAELAENFSSMDSEELLQRCQSRHLTDLAQELVEEELQRRGIAIPAPILNAPDMVDEESGRDLFAVATYYIPTDAFIVLGCLVAAGVPAVLADANLVQTDLLLSPALGGVRILAPESYLQQAQEVIEAFDRGEYRLPDDLDVGEA